MFSLRSAYSPSGDQPKAIDALCQQLHNGNRYQTLLGATGTGKTFTLANVIATIDRPTLVIAHNKTLAAQLYDEFQYFFPDNAVEYFVSYYDYYQPEAYIPSRDTYIEKTASINDEIERLRHSATRSLLTRKDVIIVASVSCIYGLGLPDTYINQAIPLQVGASFKRQTLLSQLNHIQYSRNDVELCRGRFRLNGDCLDIFAAWEDCLIRIESFDDEIEAIHRVHPVSGAILETLSETIIFPASHYVTDSSLKTAMVAIQSELGDRLRDLRANGRDIEAARLETRTHYDLDMMAEMGYCKGIENYARHVSGRPDGYPPGVLLDFFPTDFLTIIDESHVSLPQIRGMYNGDRARKRTLIDHGFRLPSAADNRPLTIDEFDQKTGQTIYVSATPGDLELSRCPDNSTVEQLIRPTGLLDPTIDIHPTHQQIPHLLTLCRERVAQHERVLITTLTKKMAEDLSQYLTENGQSVQYLHSDIQALERNEILQTLRRGEIDILVGVNLLREGLDLPEVSFVAIMDADKEGFLRHTRSLIQTIGRAARHINGHVCLYADRVSPSMQRAIDETTRRRNLQASYNHRHNIQPTSIQKAIHPAATAPSKARLSSTGPATLSPSISTLKKQMKAAASVMDFEEAARCRDLILAQHESLS